MTLRSFAYYGGKASKLGIVLPNLRTPHQTYVELFAGSAAVLINKPPVKLEIINDLASQVTAFWTALKTRPDDLIRAIMATPPGEVFFKQAIDAPPTDDVVETARRFYVRVCQSFSAQPNSSSYSFTRAIAYAPRRKTLGAIAARIRDVVVENTSAARLINRLTTKYALPQPVLIYCDPPYTKSSRVSKNIYIHDDLNHEEFLRLITTAPPAYKFAVSGYDDPLYNDYLAGWQKNTYPTYTVASDAPASTPRTEVIWRNYTVAPACLRDGPAADPVAQMVAARWRAK